MGTWRCVRVAFLICALLDDTLAAAEQIGFEITTKKTADRVEVQTQGGATTWTITSPSGIGAATLATRTGKWPEKIVLRLRLKGLEKLTLSNGTMTLAASVLSHSGHPTLLHRLDGGQEQPVDKAGPLWFEIKMVGGNKVPLKEGHFELVVPPALFRDNPKSLKLEWIDFYRG